MKSRKGKRLSKRDRERKRRQDAQRAAEPVAAEATPPPPRPPTDQPDELKTLHEDDDVMVISKPAGLLCHPSPGFWDHGTVVHALQGRIPPAMMKERTASTGEKDSIIPRAIVHRLDRGTTGVMLVAKSPRAERHLAAHFKGRSAKKRYVALLAGLPRPPSGRHDGPAHRIYVSLPIGRDPDRPGKMRVVEAAGLEGKTAQSVVHVHAHSAAHGLSLVTVELLTGRQHQIRVHTAALGAPVANDDGYGDWESNEALRAAHGPFMRGRPLLHAWSMAVAHPAGPPTPELSVRAPLPTDMREVVQRVWPELGLEPADWPNWEPAAAAAAEAPRGQVGARDDDARAPPSAQAIALQPAKRKKRKASGLGAMPPAESLVADAAMLHFAKSMKVPPPSAPGA